MSLVGFEFLAVSAGSLPLFSDLLFLRDCGETSFTGACELARFSTIETWISINIKKARSSAVD